MDEFALIKKYFSHIGAGQVELAIGDDCALLADEPQMCTAVSTDTLVAGVHFFSDCDPISLGYKSLAVNLSDLAAMGAIPSGFTLALTLPEVDEQFLNGFAQGLEQCASCYGIPLIGGDTTKGPLTITITVLGKVAKDKAMCRHLAKEEDLICVSGTLGGASYGVYAKYQHLELTSDVQGVLKYLDYPTPRLDLSSQLVDMGVRCAIDLSDGLHGDLQHILNASAVDAIIDVDKLPINPHLQHLPLSEQLQFALTGGEDYQLCFTIDPHLYNTYATKLQSLGVVCIGKIIAKQDTCIHYCGQDSDVLEPLKLQGYDHFA